MTPIGPDIRQTTSSAEASSADNSSTDSRVPADTTPVPALKRSVFFIGFMGAGKTTVSRRLARMCGVSAIDMDMFIERSKNKKVSEIFNDEGEEGFRRIETETLRELANRPPSLISCGGGIVLRPENREILKKAGFVIYLEVPVAEAASRISDTSSRPLFNDIASAQQICDERIPLYRETADAIVDTSGKEVGRIAREVKKILRKEGLW